MKSRFMPQVSFGSLVSLAILRVFYFTALLCLFFFGLSLLQQVILALHLAQIGHPWMRSHWNSNANTESV